MSYTHKCYGYEKNQGIKNLTVSPCGEGIPTFYTIYLLLLKLLILILVHKYNFHMEKI